MTRTALVLALAAVLSGCVTVVTTRESPAQRAFPRGQMVFACTTIAGLYHYLDNNDVLAGCGQVEMTAVTERGIYDSYLYGRVSIYQFQQGWKMFFTSY